MSENIAKKNITEEDKSSVCRGHNQLHMCFNCSDSECKTKGFFKMHRCKNMFYWVLCLACLLISFIAMLAVYLVIRISDENWTDITLPLSLLTIFIAVAMTALIIVSTFDFKHRTGDAVYE